MAARILIIDDDVSVTASLALLLKQGGFEYVVAADPDAALTALEQRPIDLVIQDMNFSRSTTGEEGLRLLHEIRLRRPALPVVLMTAWGSIELAVEGMRAGAADFVTKPWSNQPLLQSVRTTLSLFGARGAEDADRESLDEKHDFSEILGTDPIEVAGRVVPLPERAFGRFAGKLSPHGRAVSIPYRRAQRSDCYVQTGHEVGASTQR